MTISPGGLASLADVEIRELKLLNWRGQHEAGAGAPELFGRDLFMVDTCQRRVGITVGDAAFAQAKRLFPADGALESFEGDNAYAFLMRFACGLESKLVAETEVFGQIKQAWREFSARKSPLATQLSPWMQQLFEDAKTVRAQHLSNLGSASYGSQVRRLLGSDGGGPTLLVGAGQLAQSLAPWLEASELWLWNRTTDRAADLGRELAKRRPERSLRVIGASADEELAAWGAARNVVVCVPADPTRDPQRIQAWRAGPARAAHGAGHIIHLGLNPGSEGAWGTLSELTSLGALFDMLRAHTDLRRQQIESARRACAEKATLRSFGTGSQPHSWEDLAAFHSL